MLLQLFYICGNLYRELLVFMHAHLTLCNGRVFIFVPVRSLHLFFDSAKDIVDAEMTVSLQTVPFARSSVCIPYFRLVPEKLSREGVLPCTSDICSIGHCKSRPVVPKHGPY